MCRRGFGGAGEATGASRGVLPRFDGMAVALLTGITVTRLARCAAALLMLPAMAAATAMDPFAWLQPVVTIDAAARTRLDRGEVIVRVLPAVDAELGVFAAS